MEHLEHNIQDYDIPFFKELPLVIQGEIMENGIPIISNNLFELYEHFFCSENDMKGMALLKNI